MLAKLVLILLSTVEIVRGASKNDFSREESGQNYCDFGVPQKLYNAIDLVRCVNQSLGTCESGRSTNEKYSFDPGNKESSRSPWSDLITSIFNGDPSSNFQIPEIFNAASNQYQSGQYQQTPVGSSGSTGEFNTNLFDALYSISRYDDLKCVPRILCEVTSGATPGESIGYGRGLNGFGDFGKNMLLGLLTNFNFVETSPLLSFGKAALLGYTSRGSPRNCYQEYPKCPRNPDRLIYYLNNHNGGFFRFFNKLGLGNNPYVRPPYAVQRNNGYVYRDRLLPQKKREPFPGFGKITSDRPGTSELKFDASVLSKTWNHEANVYPEERIRNRVNRIVFPNDVTPTENFGTPNRFSKTLFGFKDDDRVNSLEDVTFFNSQEATEEDSDRLHAIRQHSQSVSTNFVFPND